MGFELKASSAKNLIQKGFKVDKCKTSLKLTMARIKLLKNKKAIQIAQMRRHIGQLLESGHDETARIRVEHIINEEKTVSAYELIDMYCELIGVRITMIESQKYCPTDLKEAVAGLIFASLRCTDVPELTDICNHFTLKYGKGFVKAAMEVTTDSGVNPLIVGKLSALKPDVETKLNVLTSIAREYNIKWDPKSFEEEKEYKQQHSEGGYLTGKQMGMESSGSKPSSSVNGEPNNKADSGPKIEEQGNSSTLKDLTLKLDKEAGLETGRVNSVDDRLHEMQESSTDNTSEQIQEKSTNPLLNSRVGMDTAGKYSGDIKTSTGVKPERRNQEKRKYDRYSKFITVDSVQDDFSDEKFAMELQLRANKLRMGTPFSAEVVQKPASDQQQQTTESHNFNEEIQQSSSSLKAEKKTVVDDMNEVNYLRSESTVLKDCSENLNQDGSSINEEAKSGRFGGVLEDGLVNCGFETVKASTSYWTDNDSILDVFFNDGDMFSPKNSTNQYLVDQSPQQERSTDDFVSQSSDFYMNKDDTDKHTKSRVTDEVVDGKMLDLHVNTCDEILFPDIWTSKDDGLHSRSSSSDRFLLEDDLVGIRTGKHFVSFPSDNLFTKEAHQELFSEEEDLIQQSWCFKREVALEDFGSGRIVSNTCFDVNIFSTSDEVNPKSTTSTKSDLKIETLLMEEKQENCDRSEENKETFPDMSSANDDEMNNSYGVAVQYDDGRGDEKEDIFSSVFTSEKKLLDHEIHDSNGDKSIHLPQNTDESTASSMFNLTSKNSFEHEIIEKDVKLLSSSELEVANHGYKNNTHEIVTWTTDIINHGDDLNEGIRIDENKITETVDVTCKDSSHVVFDDYDSDQNDSIDVFNIIDDISVDKAFSYQESESETETSLFDLSSEEQQRRKSFVNDHSSLETDSTEFSYSSISEDNKTVISVSNEKSSGIYESEEPCDHPTKDALYEKTCTKSDEEDTNKNTPHFSPDSNRDEAIKGPFIPRKKLIWISKNEPVDGKDSPSSKPTDQCSRLTSDDKTECSLSNSSPSSPSTPKTPGRYESLAENLRRKWAFMKIQQEIEAVKKPPKTKSQIKNPSNVSYLMPLSNDLSTVVSESSSEEHTESDYTESIESLGSYSYWSTEKPDSKFLDSRLSPHKPTSVKIQQEMESVQKSPKSKPLQIENSADASLLSEKSSTENGNSGILRSLGLNSYNTAKQDSKFMVSRKFSQNLSKQVTTDVDLIQEIPNSACLTSNQSVKKKYTSKKSSIEDQMFEEPPQVPLQTRKAKNACLDHKESRKSTELASNTNTETLLSEEKMKIPSTEMLFPASKSTERIEVSKESLPKTNGCMDEEQNPKFISSQESVEKYTITDEDSMANKEIATSTSTSCQSSPKTPSDGQIKKGQSFVAYFQSLRPNFRRA